MHFSSGWLLLLHQGLKTHTRTCGVRSEQRVPRNLRIQPGAPLVVRTIYVSSVHAQTHLKLSLEGSLWGGCGQDSGALHSVLHRL